MTQHIASGIANGLVRRLTIGVLGQAAWRVAVALNSIVLVPVLISAWGVGGYGQWMTITALTSYLAYSNFGLVATATNDLIMAVGAQDRQRSIRTFQMSLNLAVYLVPAAIIAVLAAIYFVPIVKLLNLADLTTDAALLVIALAGLQLWFETLRGVMVAMLYATGRYGVGYGISAAAKYAELALVVLAVGAFHARPVHVAAIMAGVALIDLVAVGLLAMSSVPWARPDFRVMDRVWLGAQLKPSMGFTFYNLSTQGVLLQGARLILGAMLGGGAVAVYAVYGTAMRLIDQLFLVLMSPIGVEISHAAGRRDSGKLARLFALGTQLSWAIFIGVSLVLLACGPWIFGIWTHQKIAFVYPMMIAYLVMAACNLLGRVSAHVLISVNQMFGVSFATLLIAAGSIGLGAALVPQFQIYGVLFGGVVGELFNSIVVFRVLSGWLRTPVRGMVADMVDISSSVAQIRSQAQAVVARYRG